MRSFNLIYLLVLACIVLGHVITMVASTVFTYFDMALIIYVFFYEKLDEDNYIGLSFIFGLYADYMRGGFFGPAVMLFLVFSYLRFRTDILMDMSKFNSKMLLYTGFAFVYTLFNAAMSGYQDDSLVRMVLTRTVADVLVIVLTLKLAGYISAAKNS